MRMHHGFSSAVGRLSGRRAALVVAAQGAMARANRCQPNPARMGAAGVAADQAATSQDTRSSEISSSEAPWPI